MVLVLFVACAGNPPIPLPEPEAPAWLAVGGCMIQSGQTPEDITYDGDGRVLASIHGRVEEVGTGLPSEGCTHFGDWRLGQESQAELRWWFTVQDDEQQKWTVGVQELGDDVAPEVGEEVYVDWTWQDEVPMIGQPGKEELYIGDFESAPIAWVGVGAGLSLFDPPNELSLSVGKEVERRKLDCYTEVAFTLRAQVGTATANLDFGESAHLGRYTVVHGGTVSAEKPTCSESAGSLTRIGMRR